MGNGGADFLQFYMARAMLRINNSLGGRVFLLLLGLARHTIVSLDQRSSIVPIVYKHLLSSSEGNCDTVLLRLEVEGCISSNNWSLGRAIKLALLSTLSSYIFSTLVTYPVH